MTREETIAEGNAAVHPLAMDVRKQLGDLCLEWVDAGVEPVVIMERLSNLAAMIAADCLAFAGIAAAGKLMSVELAAATMRLTSSLALEFYGQNMASPQGVQVQ